ncbi:hypothetical protein GOBAR_DD11429 [Gossypium barbadense]|nr:hypothetical protein GOBAR_DD11429 [Gossypium barbadense]
MDSTRNYLFEGWRLNDECCWKVLTWGMILWFYISVRLRVAKEIRERQGTIASSITNIYNGVDVKVGRGSVISDSEGNQGKTRNHCEFHHEKGYETQESVKFKALAPDMMDDKEMKLCEEIKEEKNIHTMLPISVLVDDG